MGQAKQVNGAPMKPLIISIPHRLGRAEATRGLKAGMAAARSNYSTLFKVHEETWTGERLFFNISALGQSASGTIEVADDNVRLDVLLPWLLASLAERLAPAIQKEGVLVLEKK
jgi:hypothetical protein